MTTILLHEILPYTPAEIDARVLRQRAVLARIRDLDTVAIDVITERLKVGIEEGQGREDLFAALLVVAQHDDIYDALAQQRQTVVLCEGKHHRESPHFIPGILRVGFASPAMVAAVSSIIEASIAANTSRGTAYDLFLIWAGACRHRWLWEIVHTAHQHSRASRRSDL